MSQPVVLQSGKHTGSCTSTWPATTGSSTGQQQSPSTPMRHSSSSEAHLSAAARTPRQRGAGCAQRPARFRAESGWHAPAAAAALPPWPAAAPACWLAPAWRWPWPERPALPCGQPPLQAEPAELPLPTCSGAGHFCPICSGTMFCLCVSARMFSQHTPVAWCAAWASCCKLSCSQEAA